MWLAWNQATSTLSPAVSGTADQSLYPPCVPPSACTPRRETNCEHYWLPWQICAVQWVNKMDGVVRLSSGKVFLTACLRACTTQPRLTEAYTKQWSGAVPLNGITGNNNCVFLPRGVLLNKRTYSNSSQNVMQRIHVWQSCLKRSTQDRKTEFC